MDLQGQRVLDVGSGTGVLAIAAAMLGAREVVALDIDEAAVQATASNARRNGVEDQVRIVDADLATIEPAFDVVVANIHSPVLAGLAPELLRLTAPDGLLALSGLSPAQPSGLVAVLSPMVLAWTDERTDWVAVGLGWPLDRSVPQGL